MFVRVCFLLFVLTTAQLFAADRPNVVLIMADDMGFECVEANGGNSYKTPHLNQMANGGMRFLHCHSQPICTPSRVQIMTGIYNYRNYIKFGVLDPKAKTFGHLLKKAGYKTCIVGKWQLQGGLEAPRNFGFDEYCLWQVTRRPGRYPNPGLEINGKLVDYTNGEYGPDLVSDYLCDFIERNKDESFFAYYPMMLPHWPFEPTPDSPDWDPKSKGVLKGHGDIKYFADMVKYTDKIVGKINRKLNELNLADNTIVLFTCDNGTYVKIVSKIEDREVQGGKGSPKDNGTHVPMIVRWPGKVKPNTLSDALVDFSDILPTLADVIGAKKPQNVDGRSFSKVLLGGKPDRDWIYCWYERNGKRKKASRHVRNRDFKWYADNRLFNLQVDPLELSPVRHFDEKASAIRAEFQAALKQVEQ